jgi:uncharacterized protein YcbK (DUF882 family)
MLYTPEAIKKYISTVGMPDGHFMATKNISWQELLTRQTEMPTLDVLKNLLAIANILQGYREKVFQNKPIIITSGWRSENYNAKLGGAVKSYHTKGMAIDFVVKNLSVLETQRLMDVHHNGGVEFAPNWTHIDLGTRRRFDNKNNTYKNIEVYLNEQS